MSDKKRTRVDTFLRSVRNRPVLAVVIIIGMVVIAISTFVSGSLNLVSDLESRLLPRLSSEWPARLEATIVTDAGNIIGMARSTVRPLRQLSSNDLAGLQEMLGRKDVGAANWLPLRLRITNISKDTHLLIDQIALEVQTYKPLDGEPLHEVFDVYTGDYERSYEFHQVAVRRGKRVSELLGPRGDAVHGKVERPYYDIPPGESETYFLSITATEPGWYQLLPRIEGSVLGRRVIKATESTFVLVEIGYQLERRGVWWDRNASSSGFDVDQTLSSGEGSGSSSSRFYEAELAEIVTAELAELWERSDRGAKSDLADSFHTIQVGTFASRPSAEDLRDALIAKSYPAYSEPGLGTETKHIWHVRIGVFVSRFFAEKFADVLRGKESLQAEVVEVPSVPEEVRSVSIGEYLRIIKESGVATRRYTPRVPAGVSQKDLLTVYVHLKQPPAAPLYFERGMEFVRRGDYGGASQMFRQAIEARPDYFEARYELAICLRNLGRAEEATQELAAAEHLEPGSPYLHFEWGNSLLALERHAEAIERYKMATQLSSDFAPGYYGWALGLKNLGELDAALDKLLQAIEIRPDFGLAYAEAGQLLLLMGRPSEAEVFLRRTAELTRQHVEYLSEPPDH